MIRSIKKTCFLCALTLMPLLTLGAAAEKSSIRRSQRLAALAKKKQEEKQQANGESAPKNPTNSHSHAEEAIAKLMQDPSCVDVVLDKKTGTTALMRAAAELPRAMVQALLNAGADPSIKDSEGHTTVDYALMSTQKFPNGRPEIATLITAYGHPDVDNAPTEDSAGHATAPVMQHRAQQPSLLCRVCCCCRRRK